MAQERGGIEKVLLVVLALFLPPLVAFIEEGCGFHFWFNIVLTILGWLPGFIHSAWLVLRIKDGTRHEVPVSHSPA
jgi:uncharacterized membrane protein YqaE (UPF0057 family)